MEEITDIDDISENNIGERLTILGKYDEINIIHFKRVHMGDLKDTSGEIRAVRPFKEENEDISSIRKTCN